MEKTGLLVETVVLSVENIAIGRRGLATVGANDLAEATHIPEYRYKGMPKDAFHVACLAAATRLNNTLRTPGINDIERQIYDQRSKNMSAAQGAYLVMQQNVLAHSEV